MFCGLNPLTLWSQICCVYSDRLFPSLGFSRSGNFHTNKLMIWILRRWQGEGWCGQQASGLRRTRVGLGAPRQTSWAILGDLLTLQLSTQCFMDFCASQGLLCYQEPQKGSGG